MSPSSLDKLLASQRKPQRESRQAQHAADERAKEASSSFTPAVNAAIIASRQMELTVSEFVKLATAKNITVNRPPAIIRQDELDETLTVSALLQAHLLSQRELSTQVLAVLQPPEYDDISGE